MNEKSGRRTALAIIAGLVLMCGLVIPLVHTNLALARARREGVYQTPQDGVIARANKYYCDVSNVVIEQAATNSFDGSQPHVWYVIYRVYARSHTPCDGTGSELYHKTYENSGNFYLNVKEGWVFMPEGNFPTLMGKYMKWFGLSGPGDTFHIPKEILDSTPR